MKIFNKTNVLIKGYSLAFVFTLLMVSCDQTREIDYTTKGSLSQGVVDPYIQVVTGFVPFEPGTASYDFKFNVINGEKALNQARFYKTYTDASTKESSEEVLVGTYDLSSPYRNVIELSLTYADLADGIVVNGGSLPASDEDIPGGSSWAFRFEGVNTSGEAVELPGAINMVLSKYAGLYEVIESKYVRTTSIVEDFGDWNGSEVFIGFVDETTLSYNDAWGYFAWGGCSFNFSYDPEDHIVTEVPILTACGVFSGDGPINCKDDKPKFAAIDAALGFSACGESNVIIDDDVNGEHIIKLTYGYIASTGPRQFYEVLRKKVN